MCFICDPEQGEKAVLMKIPRYLVKLSRTDISKNLASF